MCFPSAFLRCANALKTFPCWCNTLARSMRAGCKSGSKAFPQLPCGNSCVGIGPETFAILAPELANSGGNLILARLNNFDEQDRIVRTLKETKGRVGGPNGAAARMGLKRTTLLTR